MEAEPSRPADGERSGRQEQQHATAETSPGSCPPQQPQQPPNPRPVHRALGRLQNRQPKRTDLLLRLQQQQAVTWQQSDSPGTSGGSFYSPASSSTSPYPSTSSTRGEHGHGVPSQSSQEGLEGVCSPRKGEKKPQKPGKYVCTYCGRPCAKPSVLQKHIRSHTGERPYPCAPCGFSFKTKSNLYKHRKSHAHRIKAGLASSRDEPSLSGPEGSAVGEDPEEHTEGESTESEEETGQHRKSSSKDTMGQQRKVGKELLVGSEESQRPDDSQAVKQRLALRLSERKRGPMASPDDPPSSLSTSSSSQGPGSKGSTESGYFSGSGSTDLSQVSPPSASAKTYAEIILGKYGRLGGQQRGPHQQQPHTSLSSSLGTEEKSIPFAVPKTQVIEHITKLITINEAVVDTSEIDSVKPRRSSLSRKSSMESPKFITPKDPYMFESKGEAPGPSSLKHLHNPEADPAGAQELSAVPLLRSHSMPSSSSQGEPSTSGTLSPRGYRLCQSFDEQQAVVAEMRVGQAQRMLRRQPAIEVPLGAELMLEEASPTSSSSVRDVEQARQPPQQQQQQQKSPGLSECEACGAQFQHSEGYEAHKGTCPGESRDAQESRDASKTCREDRPQMMMHYKFRALAMAVRKRRKEESLEEDPPSPGSIAMAGSSTGLIPVQRRQEHSQALSGVSIQTEPKQQQQDRKGVSVIQHTSSFEKQESVSMESQGPELREQTQQPEPKPSPSTSRLIRQPNIQVPEILVTVEPDADMPSVSPPMTASSLKDTERTESFQWPQRSQTLAQLPPEKLPPKKKRLRLAEAAQSSGESSFESVSLPHSPGQESNISHASSLSAPFEDTARPEPAVWASSSQSSQMLMVPSASHHQHQQTPKEMRRSASEQTPASSQKTEQTSETRSKSFDYGSLSPQQSASSWKERRKCLLVKHATLGEPEQEEGASTSHLSRAESPKPGPSRSIHPPIYITEASSRSSLEATEKSLQLLQPQIFLQSQDVLPLQQAFPPGSLSQLLPVTTAISEVLSTQIVHRAFLHSRVAPPPVQIHPSQIHVAEQLGIPFHQLPALVPLPFSSRTRASQALYLPFPPRLSAHVTSPPTTESRPSISSMPPSLAHQSLVRISYHPPRPVIATCLAQLAPVVSLVVPVRLQTHIPTYARAMYTTLSQILASTRAQEPISCTTMVIMGQVERDKLQSSYLKVPSPAIKSLLPLSLATELASGSGEGYGPLGAGGSKRMLSPAASLELSTEAQRHQKRVKEEEEEEEGDEDKAVEEEKGAEKKLSHEEEESKATGKKLEEGQKKQTERGEATTVKVEEEQEQVPRKHNREEKEEEKDSAEKTSKKKEEVPVEEGAERPAEPSYPTLHTSASVNWCYLNYVKPNPSALRDPRGSVYSTWSVSAHNPNLPGFSTKVALSLLCSKQKHSAETYTTASASSPAKSRLAPASSRTPCVSEVHATPPSSTLTKVKQQQQKQHDKEEKKGTREEEEPSTSKQSEPSRVRIFEGGFKSNEEYIYVRGRGRGKYICGECGIRCKKPSMLKKHIRTHTDVRPYICKHCNFAFKTKGNLTKHMKSKAHGKKCQAMGVSESSLDEPESEETAEGDERACGSEEQEEHQFSDVEESEDEDDDEDDEDEESHDDPSSCSSDTHPSIGGHSSCGRRSQQGTPDPEAPGPSPSPGLEPSPRGVWPSRRAASPGSRRALFSRRGWKASPRAFSPSSESCSPSRSLSPRLELSSPIHSLSPRAELSSPGRHISPSPERGASPIRAVSPLHPISPSCYRSSQARTPPSPLWLQHRTPGYLPWESPGTKASHFKPAKRGTAAEGPALPEASLFPPAFRLSTCEGYPGHQTADNIFSHLPMHSQQSKVPYLMIPIGGIQMVQARPRSHPTTPSSPTSPPMEGPSAGRFESYWGGTPRTQGLRTPGDHWWEHQTAGTSQSGRCVLSTALSRSKQESETTDSKQYGSSHSSVHTRTPATETTIHCVRDSSRAPLSLAAPIASHVIGQQPEGEEPPPGGGPVDGGDGGAKGDRTDQST